MTVRRFEYQTVIDAWGPDIPDWIEALGKACDRTTQTQVAGVCKVSNTVISSVLRGRYRGNMVAIEALVRAHLLKETITCPALGEIGKSVCRIWRDRAKNFSGHNRTRVQMFRACEACAHFVEEGQDDG